MQNKILKYKKLVEARTDTETLWDDCYKYTFPYQNVFSNSSISLYDSTASDCVDQLSSHLLSEMTPPYSSWFSLSTKSNADEQTRASNISLHNAQEKIYQHLTSSNFFSCIHQCYLDLVILGTSCLLFEEAPLSHNSAFTFKTLSMRDVFIDDTPTNPTIYRRSSMSLQTCIEKFENFKLPKELKKAEASDTDFKLNIIECVYEESGVYKYVVFGENDNQILSVGEFSQNPFIVFRFTKSPTQFYGRSPVMKALPDIKTANKIVELVLKNASLAVSGVWQADDDGVLNPANIELTPGAIIPKAIGSSGLTPLKMGADFNISDIVLKDIRENIKSALLSTQLQPFNQNFNMSATEVLQRTSLALKVLGATYGRLQSELLTPLIMRAYSILVRRGMVENLTNKSDINITYVSKLAQLKGSQDVLNIMEWIKTVDALGSTYSAQIDRDCVLEEITQKMNISKKLLLTKDTKFEKSILEFAYKMPASLLNGLTEMADEDITQNLQNYTQWLTQKEQANV